MGPVSWEWESLQELHGGDALRASNEEQSRLPGWVGAHFNFPAPRCRSMDGGVVCLPQVVAGLEHITLVRRFFCRYGGGSRHE